MNDDGVTTVGVSDAGAAPHADARAVLEARARALARVSAVEADETLEVLEFAVLDEAYALPTDHVQGVGRLRELVPLPDAPAAVAGAALWRGALLPVLDLRRLLGSEPAGLGDSAWLIVLGVDGAELGLLTQTPRRIARVQPPADAGQRAGDLVLGVTADAVQLLNARALLSTKI